MKIVLFMKQAGIYNEGETAGFDETKPHELVTAERFVKAGAARYVELDEDGKVIEPKADEPELVDPQKELRAELDGKKKAELVVFAKEKFQIELSADLKKDEMVAEILGTLEARAAAAQLVANPELDKALELEAQQNAAKVQE
jgi:hypothetical protein